MLRGLALAALLASSAGCYSVSDATQPDSAATDSATSEPDAAVAPDAPIPDDAVAAARSGFVSIAQGRLSSEHPVLSAFFGDGAPGAVGFDGHMPCEVVESVGPCQMLSCWPLLVSDLAGMVYASDSSSMIAATATLLGGGYYADMTLGAAIAPGDMLALGASGATVPRFEGYVAMPSLPPPGTVPLESVSRSRDFVVHWSAIAADQVWVGLGVSGRLPMPPFVQCSVPASAGVITIPSSLTAQFAAGDDVDLFVSTVNVQVVSAGDYRVRVTASQWVQGLLGPVAP